MGEAFATVSDGSLDTSVLSGADDDNLSDIGLGRSSASWRAVLEMTVFDAMFAIVSRSSSQPIFSILVLLIEFGQIAAFAFHKTFEWGPWSGDVMTPTLNVVSLRLVFSSFDVFRVVNALVYAALLLAWADAVYVGLALRDSSRVRIWPLRLLRYAVAFAVTVLYIPIMSILLTPLACDYAVDPPVLYDYSDTKCVTGEVVTYGVISGVLMVMFLCATAALSLVYFHDSPDSGHLLARPHARVDCATHVAKSVLLLAFAILPNERTLLGVILIGCTASIFGLHVVFMALYNTRLQVARTGGFLALTWLASMALGTVGGNGEDSNSNAMFVAALAGVPVFAVLGAAIGGWRLMYVRRRHALNAVVPLSREGKKLRKFHLVTDVELVARALIESANVDAANTVFRAGFEQFPDSVFLLLCYVRFLASVGNTAMAHAYLDQSLALPARVDLRFLRYRKLREVEQAQLARGLTTGTMDLISYVQFETMLRTARSHHNAAIRSLANFWRTLLRSDRAFLERSAKLIARIDESERSANNYYRQLVRKYPNTPGLLVSYATFLDQVSNRPILAERFLRKARRVAMATATDEGGGGGAGAGAGGTGGVGGPDDTGAMALVNGAIDAIVTLSEGGGIASVNSHARKLLGYDNSKTAKVALRGEPFMTTLLMPPFSDWQDALLGSASSLTRTFVFDMKCADRSRKRVALSLVRTRARAAQYIAVMRPLPEADTRVAVYCLRGGAVVGVSGKPEQLLGIHSDALMGTHIMALFPSSGPGVQAASGSVANWLSTMSATASTYEAHTRLVRNGKGEQVPVVVTGLFLGGSGHDSIGMLVLNTVSAFSMEVVISPAGHILSTTSGTTEALFGVSEHSILGLGLGELFALNGGDGDEGAENGVGLDGSETVASGGGAGEETNMVASTIVHATFGRALRLVQNVSMAGPQATPADHLSLWFKSQDEASLVYSIAKEHSDDVGSHVPVMLVPLPLLEEADRGEALCMMQTHPHVTSRVSLPVIAVGYVEESGTIRLLMIPLAPQDGDAALTPSSSLTGQSSIGRMPSGTSKQSSGRMSSGRQTSGRMPRVGPSMSSLRAGNRSPGSRVAPPRSTLALASPFDSVGASASGAELSDERSLFVASRDDEPPSPTTRSAFDETSDVLLGERSGRRKRSTSRASVSSVMTGWPRQQRRRSMLAPSTLVRGAAPGELRRSGLPPRSRSSSRQTGVRPRTPPRSRKASKNTHRRKHSRSRSRSRSQSRSRSRTTRRGSVTLQSLEALVDVAMEAESGHGSAGGSARESRRRGRDVDEVATDVGALADETRLVSTEEHAMVTSARARLAARRRVAQQADSDVATSLRAIRSKTEHSISQLGKRVAAFAIILALLCLSVFVASSILLDQAREQPQRAQGAAMRVAGLARTVGAVEAVYLLERADTLWANGSVLAEPELRELNSLLLGGQESFASEASVQTTMARLVDEIGVGLEAMLYGHGMLASTEGLHDPQAKIASLHEGAAQVELYHFEGFGEVAATWPSSINLGARVRGDPYNVREALHVVRDAAVSYASYIRRKLQLPMATVGSNTSATAEPAAWASSVTDPVDDALFVLYNGRQSLRVALEAAVEVEQEVASQTNARSLVVLCALTGAMVAIHVAAVFVIVRPSLRAASKRRWATISVFLAIPKTAVARLMRGGVYASTSAGEMARSGGGTAGVPFDSGEGDIDGPKPQLSLLKAMSLSDDCLASSVGGYQFADIPKVKPRMTPLGSPNVQVYSIPNKHGQGAPVGRKTVAELQTKARSRSRSQSLNQQELNDSRDGVVGLSQTTHLAEGSSQATTSPAVNMVPPSAASGSYDAANTSVRSQSSLATTSDAETPAEIGESRGMPKIVSGQPSASSSSPSSSSSSSSMESSCVASPDDSGPTPSGPVNNAASSSSCDGLVQHDSIVIVRAPRVRLKRATSYGEDEQHEEVEGNEGADRLGNDSLGLADAGVSIIMNEASMELGAGVMDSHVLRDMGTLAPRRVGFLSNQELSTVRSKSSPEKSDAYNSRLASMQSGSATELAWRKTVGQQRARTAMQRDDVEVRQRWVLWGMMGLVVVLAFSLLALVELQYMVNVSSIVAVAGSRMALNEDIFTFGLEMNMMESTKLGAFTRAVVPFAAVPWDDVLARPTVATVRFRAHGSGTSARERLGQSLQRMRDAQQTITLRKRNNFDVPPQDKLEKSGACLVVDAPCRTPGEPLFEMVANGLAHMLLELVRVGRELVRASASRLGPAVAELGVITSVCPREGRSGTALSVQLYADADDIRVLLWWIPLVALLLQLVVFGTFMLVVLVPMIQTLRAGNRRTLFMLGLLPHEVVLAVPEVAAFFSLDREYA
ncbi:uncharacterized protein AMSG_02918 [Thecamonas trahens ATCC 50062]|uniref:TmcB/TmcC TPR repeats domain-containing protein n=1 Tax=Thecamonas trahens ATCC 50062 TaxID=461836 RepID=A0A0L0D596_THETB|nr:hypothetical protein AMSG_02918 [Thecamonas trahens ATCC 50062]KNC46483.1 hypothetical protein AMSG_02918 [Thecamonas trahens ATCC 50062]|eukprot:XP_013760264.1 hypothetical protein AMSG_02918 [Thecamonas trahens ATCC 50062]